ncbi:MAG: hypothetical protein HUJ64_03060 [Limosilactobacillus mucosae]|nr:hypothetical protein [Limosilactobacillus mucosae]
MAVTQITAGQKDWLSTLNSDLSQIGDKVSSQLIPVTFINGFSGNISVRRYQFGSSMITTVEGWFNTGSATIKGGTPTGIFKLPANTDIGMVFAWTNSANMLNGRVVIKTDGTVTVELENELGGNNFVDILGMRAY